MKFTPENEYQERHIALMRSIAQEVTKLKTDTLTLKGGTAFMLAYDLERFSVDLDFDGKKPHVEITKAIEQGAKNAGIPIESISCKKTTQTARKYSIHYKGCEGQPLTIDMSYRDKDRPISELQAQVLDGIRVYEIGKLSELKIEAFLDRMKPRDIFDTAFIIENHSDKLKPETIRAIKQKCDEHGLDDLVNVMLRDRVLVNHDHETIILQMDAKLEALVCDLARDDPPKPSTTAPPPTEAPPLTAFQKMQQAKRDALAGKKPETAKPSKASTTNPIANRNKAANGILAEATPSSPKPKRNDDAR